MRGEREYEFAGVGDSRFLTRTLATFGSRRG
jgi:hypothetical protein